MVEQRHNLEPADAEKYALDRAILEARGLTEPPLNENDIRSLESLTPFAGQVVKYTQDGGKTWEYAKLEQEPSRFSDRSVGYSTYTELLPNVPSDERYSLTNLGFIEGLVVRPTTPEEIKGIKFSYESDGED